MIVYILFYYIIIFSASQNVTKCYCVSSSSATLKSHFRLLTSLVTVPE